MVGESLPPQRMNLYVWPGPLFIIACAMNFLEPACRGRRALRPATCHLERDDVCKQNRKELRSPFETATYCIMNFLRVYMLMQLIAVRRFISLDSSAKKLITAPAKPLPHC